MQKGTKAYSIFKFKCPHCHEGDFFKGHPYNLLKAGDTPEKCDVCDNKFSKEPGFYFGAMYVSYGLGVALFVANYVLISFFAPEADYTAYLISIAITVIGLGPLVYAMSKIIWANMFFTYDEKWIKNKIENS